MTETPPVHANSGSNGRAAFHLAGGGAAWMIHLLLVYLIAEFGCLAGFDRFLFLNLTAVVWLLITASIIALALGIWATVSAWKTWKQTAHRAESKPETENGDGECFAARTGFWLNGFFSFVILVESLPILYFLQAC